MKKKTYKGGPVKLTTKEFIRRARQVHGNRYDYSKVKYEGSHKKVIIICREHGEFEQTPGNHIHGQNCRKCRNYTGTLNRGWKRSEWIDFCNKAKNAEPKVYIIRCFNDDEEFIKIGITSRTVAGRFKFPSDMPYSYEVLKEIKGSPDFVWDKEKELHRKYKKYRYKPKLSFGGETECFTLNICNSL